MLDVYTQFGLSSKYSYEKKNCTIPYFIILINNRANFAVRGPKLFKRMVFIKGRCEIVTVHQPTFVCGQFKLAFSYCFQRINNSGKGRFRLD